METQKPSLMGDSIRLEIFCRHLACKKLLVARSFWLQQMTYPCKGIRAAGVGAQQIAEKHMAGYHLLGPFFCPASLSEEEDESSDASSADVVALSSSSSLSDAPAQKREACSQQINLCLLKLIGAAHSRMPIRYL